LKVVREIRHLLLPPSNERRYSVERPATGIRNESTMDDLDREIEEAVRLTRRRVRRGRLATIASVATFFLVAIFGGIVVFEVFPEPDVSDFEVQREQQKARGDASIAEAITDDYAANARDQSRVRFKVIPIAGLAFAAAYLVFKRLTPVP
jgi:hypothetical protein